MSHREAWIFFGDHGVSAAPFADNLPGLQNCSDPDAGWMAPDEPMLPAVQVCIASLVILAVTVGTLLAGIP
jgi:hypothetical protein